MIRSYSEQLGISSRDMQVRNISTDGSWWFAEYKQQVRGIPVKYSEIGFTIDPEGYIVTLGAYAFPDIKEDRKSTRLNSSHVAISYAVFCLKKKTNTSHTTKSKTN